MRKTILIYGLSLAGLVALLKFIEYRFLIRDLSLEFYVGAVALLFTGLGIWAGLKITRRRTVLINPNFVLNDTEIKRLGISPRELEVLELIQKVMDQINQTREIYKNPFLRFGLTLMEIFPVGLVIALISAGILRKRGVFPA